MSLEDAINILKENPQELQLFLQSQQDNMYKQIVAKKDNDFNKAYGDFENIMNSKDMVNIVNNSNKDIDSLTEKIVNEQTKVVNELNDKKNTELRKYEMNEWSVNNKKETLFIFSQLFIALCALTIIGILYNGGIIGTGLSIGLSLPFILIFVFTVVYRSQYTDTERDKRYWNRRGFRKQRGTIPNICPGLESEVSAMSDNIESSISSIITSGEKEINSEIDKTSDEIKNMKMS
jgi:hypothetical protein